MTDYYPLISRAVTGLEKNTGESRRGLYERARTALVAQLRGLNPPLTESEITRERLGLEEAIRKVEAEAARRPQRIEALPRATDAAAKSADAARSGAKPDPVHRDDGARPGDRTAPPLARRDGAAAAAVSAVEARRAEAAASETAPARNSGRARFNEKSQLTDEGLKGFRDVVASAENLGEATMQAGRTARQAYAAVPSSVPELDRLEPRIEPQGLRVPAREARPREAQLREAPPREAPQREAPQREPPREAPRSLDPPRPLDPFEDEFEPLPAPEPRSQESRQPEPRQPEPKPADPRKKPRGMPMRVAGHDDEADRPRRSAKGLFAALLAVFVIVGLGVGLYWQRVPLKTFFMAMRGQTSQSLERGIPPPTQPKSDARVGQPSTTASQGPIAAVAQRVVLYEEDPTDAQGKRYIGSVIWRTEMMSPGAGLNPELAVRADLEIPDRRITMTMSVRRNTDQALPASHTVEIMFNLPADFPFGGVNNVPGILMKQAEQTRGAPLAGLAVKVTSGFFLVGLSAVESEMQRNMELLKERTWFDIPIVYNNGRRAILAIEKGTPGERAFAQAFAAWAAK